MSEASGPPSIGVFVLGVLMGPSIHRVFSVLAPYVARAFDAICDSWCPERPVKKPHVPSLAETFDDLDAVTAAHTLANLRRRRPGWALEPSSAPEHQDTADTSKPDDRPCEPDVHNADNTEADTAVAAVAEST